MTPKWELGQSQGLPSYSEDWPSLGAGDGSAPPHPLTASRLDSTGPCFHPVCTEPAEGQRQQGWAFQE